jgi:hypothetical protein
VRTAGARVRAIGARARTTGARARASHPSLPSPRTCVRTSGACARAIGAHARAPGARVRTIGAYAPAIGRDSFLVNLVIFNHKKSIFKAKHQKMKHQYYLPHGDLDRLEWMNNFAQKLPGYATLLGLTPGQISALLADADMLAIVILLLAPFRDFVQNLTGYKKALMNGSAAPIGDIPAVPVINPHTAVAAGVFVRVAALVRIIKASPNYNDDTIGKDLGTVGSEVDINYGDLKPEPKLILKNEHAYVTWAHNHTEATDVYADYDDGVGMHFVARIVKSHYLDPHIPAANTSKVFKFKLHYVLDNEPIGEESEIVSITVTGPKV